MISLVIPLYNEEPSLVPLLTQVHATARAHSLNVETIFVDDGSRDGSWPAIKQLASTHANVMGIRLRRNFGKAAALAAGFHAARGSIIVTLDADLQDDPAEIPRLLAKLDEGFDLVTGWKLARQDSWTKRFASWGFNTLVGWTSGLKLHDHNCGLKAYRQDVVREIRMYGELHRFTPVLAAARGFRVTEVPVNHRPREHGKSKYGLGRLFKGFLDLVSVKFITGFGGRPQHFLGGVGLLSFVLGNLGLLATLLLEPGTHWAWLVTVYALVATLLGAQLLIVGLLAELITANTRNDRDHFSIAERVEAQHPSEGTHERNSQ